MKQLCLYITIKIFLLLFLQLTGTVSCAQEANTVKEKWQTQPDTSLINYSEHWKVKTPGKRKVTFGPFKIIGYESGNAKKLNKERNGNIFRYDRVTNKTKSTALTVLYHDNDSIFINALIRLSDESEGSNIKLLGLNEDKQTHTAKCSEMYIRHAGDTSTWDFIPSLLSPGNRIGFIDYFGKLVNGQDTISIVYAKSLEGLEKVWRGYPTGLFFLKDFRQIAALLYGNDYYVWLTTLPEERIKIAVGSFITAFTSILQN